MGIFESLFDEDDFQGHPDLNAIEVNPSQYPTAKIVVEERFGKGHVLSDGNYVFPGDDFITKIITN